MKGYALFAGCLIYARVPHVEAVSVKVLSRLGVNVERLSGFTCCPEPMVMKMFGQRAWYTLAARNLAVAEEAGLDILTLCNGCNYTLLKVAKELSEDPELKERVNEELKLVGRRYSGRVEVKSVLRVLYEEVGGGALRRAVVRPLEELRVAVHHGCHIYDELSLYDDVARPRAFKSLLSAIGCKVVDYPLEGLCCGAFIRPVDEDLSTSIVKEKLEEVTRIGADCIAVVCPMCLIQLDAGQALILRRLKTAPTVPVLYLTQLIGLSLGMGEDEVGLKYHSVAGLKKA
ncbi:MAG: CoB--CoM heterodisulfide reductase iron-sulfur subunit B family protein [Candidatus Nezhaarchaeota archaeon]|nr:CoB--CoM heterodisulfide reductase iron-sulfur subunit B family protein [Candidatus Nezhaarchaeota archaeon]